MARKAKEKKVEKAVENNPFATTENSGSDEPLLIDADTTALSLQSLKDAVGALSFLHDMLGKGTATVGTRHNSLFLAKNHLERLEGYLGAKDDQKQEEELRNNQLRFANMEIHRLREEMGKGVTIEAIGLKLHRLEKTIYNWWQNQGFTYSKSQLNPNYRGANFLVEFSVRIDRHISSMATKPVTARAKIAAKREALGKELEIVHDGDEPYVIDNPNNRQWLTNLFMKRFPTCRIFQWKSISCNRLNIFQIRDVEVNIDITDVGDVFEENEKLDD